jgi:hypothetical protein
MIFKPLQPSLLSPRYTCRLFQLQVRNASNRSSPSRPSPIQHDSPYVYPDSRSPTTQTDLGFIFGKAQDLPTYPLQTRWESLPRPPNPLPMTPFGGRTVLVRSMSPEKIKFLEDKQGAAISDPESLRKLEFSEALRTMETTLTQNRVALEQKGWKRWERRSAFNRRKKSERWRRRFSNIVSRHVGLARKLRRMGV